MENYERRYRLLFEEDLAGACITSGKGIINDCNRSFLKIFGYSEKSQLTGRHIKTIYADESEYELLIARLKEDKQPGDYEAIRKRRNGEVVNVVEKVSASFDAEGNITEIISYFFDITDRKRAEQVIREGEKTARTLLNASGSTNILINASDNRIVQINNAGSLLFGTTPENIKGRNASRLFRLVSDLFPEKLQESVREVKTVRFQNVNGGKYYYNQIYPIKTDNGEVSRVAVFIQDITELHQIKELKELNVELSELNATKDRLFSVIAHDLRSPISGILNLSGLLNRNFRKYQPEKAEIYLKSICDTAENVLTLLDNLLVWAKSRRGQIDFYPVIVSLNSVIPEIIEVLSASAENKNIRILNNIDHDIFCHADVNMLKSILRNLVQNSIKFTNPGGQVCIDAAVKNSGVEVTVRDTGIGIPDGIKQKLFELSSNITTGGTYNEKGSGLGLILCREFVEKHSGRIWVESEEGKGSKFTFLLPYSIRETA